MASRAVAEPAPRAVEPGKANRAPPVGAMSSAVVDVTSSIFAPSATVTDEITASGGKGLNVRVIAKGLTEEGHIKVRKDRFNKFHSLGSGSMPILNPWTQKLGGMHLVFAIENSAIKDGYASLAPKGGGKNKWLQTLQNNATPLGGLGLKIESLPKPVNRFENGKLELGVTGARIVVGGYVDADFDLLLENMNKPKIKGSAKIVIGGTTPQELLLEGDGDKLTGSVSLAVTYKSFSGAVKLVYLADGTVDVAGKAAFSADKLSGEIQFVATDFDAANKFARDAIAAAGGKENVQNAGAPAPVPVAKEGQKKRALAATGQLGFNLTKWFAGTVNVVVDGKGAITVIGKIAPPGEIILFKQRDWDKQIVKFEAKAYYGIPVVGNLNLFANISLHAIAKLGPAKLYAIEILGTYSTDPEIQKSIQISGSLNISAYAGLRLRAEGGAGIEILKHDLKFGIGLNADVGVKAYADARPTIGYRDPGDFYISGTLDLVAQPMLGLSGEFFIELDAPWFSPIDDDRWSWPLFSKEWPLSDPIGISATLKDYVLGSGNVPEITMKPPEFDPSKFMSNMVDDKLPNKSGGAGSGQGKFKEDGSVPKPVVPPKKPAPKAAPAKPAKKGPKLANSKSGTADPKGPKEMAKGKSFQNAAKQLTALEGKGLMTRETLDQELARIRNSGSGIDFSVREQGAKWLVAFKPSGKVKKAVELKRKESGKAASDAKPAKDKVSKTIILSGKSHLLEIVADGGRIKMFMQSKRGTLHEKLNNEAKLWLSSGDPEVNASGNALAARLSVVDKREQTLGQTYAAATTDTKRHALAVAGVDEIATLLVLIANEFGIGFEVEDVPTNASCQTSGLNLGRATAAYADPITILSLRPTQKGRTQIAPEGWLKKGVRKAYPAGHLVADTFGGTDSPGNLASISVKTNGRFSSVESRIRKALKGTKKLPVTATVLRYETVARFASDPAGEIEAWLSPRLASTPGAKIAGAGSEILQLIANRSLSPQTIDKALRLKPTAGAPMARDLSFYDRLEIRAAYAYLARGFTISIKVKSGKPIDGASFDNHIDGMVPPT